MRAFNVVAGLLAAALLVGGSGEAAAARGHKLVSHWKLDESSGTFTYDSASRELGTLHGGTLLVPGRDGNALALDGVDDYMSGDAPVRTSESFTVSTWVNLANKDCDLTVTFSCKLTAVSMDGERTSSFRLGHIVDSDQNMFGAWYFEMPEADVDYAPVTMTAVSTLPTELDTWVHLVGVHDAASRKVWLYVNGTRLGDGTINTPWQAPGELRIGGGKVDGAATEFWWGKVDDVRIYARTLDDTEVSTLFWSYLR